MIKVASEISGLSLAPEEIEIVIFNAPNKLSHYLGLYKKRFLTDIAKDKYEIIICSRGITRDIVKMNLKNLRLIQLLSTGYDGVPIQELRAQGVMVSNAGSVYAHSIAETVTYGILRYIKKIRTNPNNTTPDLLRRYETTELFKKHVLIMGAGNIGRLIAKQLGAFDANIDAYDPYAEENILFGHVLRSKEVLLSELHEYDFIISTMPLTKETENFCDNTFFERMKNSSVFYNIGRDGTVIQKDFMNALKHKTIGAIISEVKPIPFKCLGKYRGLDNVLVLPGIETSSKECDVRLRNMIQQNLIDYLNNKEISTIVN